MGKSPVEEAEKKAKEAARGSVTLHSLVLDMPAWNKAAVMLTCSDVEQCSGELALTTGVRHGKGKERRARTERIGASSFTISAGKSTTVEVPLVKGIRALLKAAHGHLDASLTIRRVLPPPAKTQIKSVRLEEHAANA